MMYSESDNSLVADGMLVVRPARSHLSSMGGQQQDLLERFSRHGVDAWTAMQNLASTQHGGVRDYLINRMYELCSEDIDFFLSQLCALVISWPEHECEALERFLLHKCSKSLHCAMKMYWLLLSMAPYCALEVDRQRCQDLAKRCETTVVNACMPKHFLPLPSGSPPTCASPVAASASVVPPVSVEHDECEFDLLLVRSLRVIERLRSLEPRLHAQYKRLQLPAPEPLQIPYTDAVALSISIPRSHSEESFMSPDDHHMPRIIERRSSGSRSKSPAMHRLASDGSFSPTLPKNFRDYDMFLAKQQMAEFFTAELHLIGELEEISNDLLQFPRSHRNLRLQRLLTVFNENACRGLYFPNCQADDRHYVILRVLPQESVALSSRDKVPFLMQVEVLYSAHDCSGEVHLQYQVERESSRRRLLQLMSDSTNAVTIPAHRRSPSGASTRRSSSASSRARHSREDFSNCKFAYPFGELLEERKRRIRKTSPYGRLQNWDLKMCIFKSGDDCRQEHLAMQIITYIDSVFKEAKLPLRLRPYEVLVTSPTSGMLEVVPDARSIDGLKKSIPDFVSLLWFFENHFGPRGSQAFTKAQKNFVESMAAYSLVCYLLQIKDRHNGNIMLDNLGYIIHIDFGFMLSNSPGGNINFERAPFKLTGEYIEVMEGEESEVFNYYRLLMIRGFLELRKHCDRVVTFAEILFKGPRQDCFYSESQTLIDLRERFHATDSEQQCVEFVYSLVSQSINNWRSVQYDTYQRITNGIL